MPTASNVSPSLHIGDDGLYLGSTRLMRRATSRGRCSLSIEEDADRCLALLSVAYRFSVAQDLIRHVRAADGFWGHGEPAVANLRLLFIGLPRLVDPTALARVQAADFCLETGLTTSVLLKELGIERHVAAVEKYDAQQPRVPAGNGRPSGQWVKDALSFLERATPQIVAALTRFASRFSTPTAVLGALFIPTPNSGGVTSGTLPGAPDIRFDKDCPAGRLSLSTTAADGSAVKVEAQLQGGMYVDISSGVPIGRDLGDQLYLDLDTVRKVIEDTQTQTARGDPDEKPKAATDEPRLCPAPTPDTGHGASDRANAYEDQVHQRVNPLAPLPSGFGVRLTDPQTGAIVFLDDCFRFAGDLVDNDMRAGDVVEAKGERNDYLYSKLWSGALDDDVEQAQKELRAADAQGVRLKWYFAEQGAADQARAAFAEAGLGRIVISVMPLRKSHGWTV